MTKYYHVIKKNGAWHLYAGNAPSALATDPLRTQIIKAARSLARQDGARIILHKEEAPEMTYGPVDNVDAAVLVNQARKS